MIHELKKICQVELFEKNVKLNFIKIKNIYFAKSITCKMKLPSGRKYL